MKAPIEFISVPAEPSAAALTDAVASLESGGLLDDDDDESGQEETNAGEGAGGGGGPEDDAGRKRQNPMTWGLTHSWKEMLNPKEGLMTEEGYTREDMHTGDHLSKSDKMENGGWTAFSGCVGETDPSSPHSTGTTTASLVEGGTDSSGTLTPFSSILRPVPSEGEVSGAGSNSGSFEESAGYQTGVTSAAAVGLTSLTRSSSFRGIGSESSPAGRSGPGNHVPVGIGPTGSGSTVYGASFAAGRPASSTIGETERTTLWIGDLEKWEDETHLFNVFNEISPNSVVSVKIARDRDQRRPLSYGFVDFVSRDIAQHILKNANNLVRPGGKRFKLTWAHGKTRQPFFPPPGTAPPRGGWAATQDATTEAKEEPWSIEVGSVSPITTPQLFRDLILSPLQLTNAVRLEINNDKSEPALKVVFDGASAFLTFASAFPDGYFELCRCTFFYTIPSDVLSRWNTLYDQVLASTAP